MTREELDGAGDIFGWKLDFTPGRSSNGLVRIYLADDEWYKEKLSFDISWIYDLKNTINQIEQALKEKE